MAGLSVIVALLLCTIAAGLFAGCEHRYRYYYMSFEDVDGIRVERRGTYRWLELEVTRNIPLEYRLVRPLYEIELRHDTRSFTPAVEVSVVGWQGTVRPRPDLTGDPENGAGVGCGRFHAPDTTSVRFEFIWEYCGARAPVRWRVLAFDLLDSGGNLVAVERLSFDLELGGVYRATDSL